MTKLSTIELAAKSELSEHVQIMHSNHIVLGEKG